MMISNAALYGKCVALEFMRSVSTLIQIGYICLYDVPLFGAS